MAPVPASVARQAELLRQDGNTFFKKDRIRAAIDAYTEAIALCPNVAVYLTNRALCYRKRDGRKLREDCRKAIAIDKAHYMLGLALFERQEYAGVLGKWRRSIWSVLAKSQVQSGNGHPIERLQRLQSLKIAWKQTVYLSEVFSKAALADTPSQVPDYLCCQITLDIFRDPVITPSGITYERAVLLEHLQKVGKFDPLTREPLEQHQLVPNLAIKEAVQAFLNEHGWAYKS
ncbi:hypothetical protein J5N97_020864 [Dioscorea zingiberensis]|uniref:E3 ubiquitin-protein ligase CHIP n=1 Tax=Dioscorea zingiberensis TaxID=325984 RepID=A0A9D5CHA1_9LILI|nr:hypothetical protein J5N97_020864 [Dioscorea zingiberensis]